MGFPLTLPDCGPVVQFCLSSITACNEQRNMPDSLSGYALSVKQPWAALLVAGRKTIEVRRWSTGRRGRILIHAAGIPDPRPEAWKLVPPELEYLARRNGGLLGACDLVECRTYRRPEAFAADVQLHLCDPKWFQEPVMYGFLMTRPVELPFQPCSGWMRFFRPFAALPVA